MPPASYRVLVVLSESYGARLLVDVETGRLPMWILESRANRAAAQEFWAKFPDRDHLNGVTLFTPKTPTSVEESFIVEMGTIGMHHNEFSVLEVEGIPLTTRIVEELTSYGFDQFHEAAEGFRATRTLPSNSAYTAL